MFFFFQAEDGIRDIGVTGVQTCALPICRAGDPAGRHPLRGQHGGGHRAGGPRPDAPAHRSRPARLARRRARHPRPRPPGRRAAVTLTYYLVLAAILFTIGAVGVLVRRNAIVVFMCVELMLNSVNLTLVTFARATGTIDGQIMAFFVMVVAAADRKSTRLNSSHANISYAV